MIKYNNIIINPKNIDFVKPFLGTTIEVVYANGEKCNICTRNIEEATELVDEIYKDMKHSWSCELRAK